MHAAFRSLVALGLAVIPLACGGSNQTPPQTPAVSVAPEPIPEQTVELSRVDEPDGLFAIVRLRNPGESERVIKQWLGQKSSDSFWINGISALLGNRNAEEFIDPDSPVGFISSVPTRGRSNTMSADSCISFGLRSSHAAREYFLESGEVKELDGSAFLGRLTVGEDTKIICYVGPSLGKTSSRIACGSREREVSALAPYMMRGFPVADFPDNDLYAELRVEPLLIKYGALLANTDVALASLPSILALAAGIDDLAVASAIGAAVKDLLGEAVRASRDTHDIRLRVSLEPKAQVLTGEYTFSLKSKSSWLANFLADQAALSGAVPPLFWSAPADSTSASFSRESSSNTLAPIQKHAVSIADAALASHKLPAPDRKAIDNLIERLIDHYPLVSGASGSVAPKTNPSSRPVEIAAEAIGISVGWHLYGFDESSQRIDKLLSDIPKVYGRAAIQRTLRDKWTIDASNMPKLTYGPLALAGLAGLKALQVSIPATSIGGEKKDKPILVYIMMLPIGNQTWVAAGADRDTLEKQLKTVKAGGSGTLNSRAGLDELRDGSYVSAGFMSIAAIMSSATSSVLSWAFSPSMESLQDLRGEAQSVANMLFAMPNGGNTPIQYTLSVQPGTPSVATIRFKIDSGSIADLRSVK